MKHVLLAAALVSSIAGCGPKEEVSKLPDVRNQSQSTRSTSQTAAIPENNSELTVSTSLPAGVKVTEFAASPDAVCSNASPSVIHVSWDVTAVRSVEVRIGSPSGALFAKAHPKGGKDTGPWAGAGTRFYLQNGSSATPTDSGSTLATLTVGRRPPC